MFTRLSIGAFFVRHIRLIEKFLETDSTELSTRSRDVQSMQSFRSRTSIFVRKSLGFAATEDDVATGPPESDPLITSFGVVGEALVTWYTLGKACKACFTKAC